MNHGEHVYFVQCTLTRRIKIGYSVRVPDRLANMRSGSPTTLTLLHVTPGGVDLERLLHKAFSQYRLHGEWFEDTPLIHEYITTDKLQVVVPIPPPQHIQQERLHAALEWCEERVG